MPNYRLLSADHPADHPPCPEGWPFYTESKSKRDAFAWPLGGITYLDLVPPSERLVIGAVAAELWDAAASQRAHAHQRSMLVEEAHENARAWRQWAGLAAPKEKP